MRSSLGQIFLCLFVGACLSTTAFGQARTNGVIQSADYWQPSSTKQTSVIKTVGYNQGSDCGCAAQAAPMPAESVSDTGGECNTCGPSVSYDAGCSTGGCSTGGCSTGACGVDACTTCGPAMDACSPAGCGMDYGMGGCGEVCGPYMNPCKPNQWFLTGWLQQGVTINPYSPADKFNGTLRYNDRANDYQMNQLYLTAGRSVNSESCNWDIGGRIDMLYGTDYYFTSALGWETETNRYGGTQDTLDPTAAELKWNNNDGARRGGTAAMYGFSIPQLYGEVQAPMGTNVKLGHFYSPMGHESVMATQNFFYSHSYAMMYGEPTTLTGMLISQRVTQNWTGFFGIHRGWDKWESPIDSISYIAGAKWENIYRTTSLGFLLNTGTDCYSNIGLPRTETNRMNYSLVFSHQLSPNIHYVLQHDLGIDQDAAYGLDTNAKVVPLDGKWYSITQYIYMQMTDTLAFGCRAEWFKDENHSRILKPAGPIYSNTSSISGDDYVELSLGLNWKPTPFILLRPEVRWDWVEGREIKDSVLGTTTGPFGDYDKTNQFTIATDLVINF